ncbi:MAG: aminotransferase class IV [Sulfurimonas sp.]|nr:aminotransferase class IV [Sulfurimonas sp.]
MKSNFLETIKIFDGKVYNMDYHQKRYESVLSSFSVTLFQDLSRLIQAPKKGLYKCRIVYNCESILDVTYHPYVKPSVTSLQLVYDDAIEYSMKYEKRNAIKKLFELREGCDDILIVKNGLITDTSIANIALYDGVSWLTPTRPLLRGTTRERLLKNKKIVESNICVDELNKFSKIALLNAMIDFDIITNMTYVK